MTELNSIQDLKENSLGHKVISNILAPFGDTRKKISFGTILNDNESTIHIVQNLHQRNHVGMLTGMVMKLYLTLLELSLPGI
jgi:hypothetical protein